MMADTRRPIGILVPPSSPIGEICAAQIATILLSSYAGRAQALRLLSAAVRLHVAFMLHGADWQPLKTQGKILQHARHGNPSEYELSD
jgi:hypothetical protein